MSSSPNKKLSLSPEMLTPPLRSSVSVPFRWEEAPGRPHKNDRDEQPNDDAKSVRRSLELPPRLLPARDPHDQRSRHHLRITNMPSPTTVLDGPDTSRSLSYGASSFRSFRSPEGALKRDRVGYFGSRRWGSFRKNSTKKLVGIEGSNDFSCSVVDGDCEQSNGGGDGGQNGVSKVKMRRRGGLLSVSTATRSHLWGSIYESLKQVVAWKRVRNKTRK